jgi:hypothetical protein
MAEKVYVSCKILPSAFPRERAFEIESPGGQRFQGLASVRYFLSDAQEPLLENQARELRGWVAARVLSREPRTSTATVSVPIDGVVTVAESQLQTRALRV